MHDFVTLVGCLVLFGLFVRRVFSQRPIQRFSIYERGEPLKLEVGKIHNVTLGLFQGDMFCRNTQISFEGDGETYAQKQCILSVDFVSYPKVEMEFIDD